MKIDVVLTAENIIHLLTEFERDFPFDGQKRNAIFLSKDGLGMLLHRNGKTYNVSLTPSERFVPCEIAKSVLADIEEMERKAADGK